MIAHPKMREATRIQAEGTRYVVCDVCGEAFVIANGYRRTFAQAELAAAELARQTGRRAAVADRLSIDGDDPDWVIYSPDGTGRRWNPGPVQVDWSMSS